MKHIGFMQVLPFDEQEQRKIYKNCSKKQLIDFLIERDKISESQKLNTSTGDNPGKFQTSITSFKDSETFKPTTLFNYE